MAEIISLERTPGRTITIRTRTVADYNMDGTYFSIWTYKNDDFSRSGNCPQNLQFDKEMAHVLRDALNDFLMDNVDD